MEIHVCAFVSHIIKTFYYEFSVIVLGDTMTMEAGRRLQSEIFLSEKLDNRLQSLQRQPEGASGTDNTDASTIVSSTEMGYDENVSSKLQVKSSIFFVWFVSLPRQVRYKSYPRVSQILPSCAFYSVGLFFCPFSTISMLVYFLYTFK